MADITQHQKDQLLDALMYYLPMDIRQKLMRELPQAYNAWCGREIVRVVPASEPGRIAEVSA